jgi:hypothetical protein
LTCYQIHGRAVDIVPARADRAWMDATDQRAAYRCLPLSIANAMGWELVMPATVVATWRGSAEFDGVDVEVSDPSWADGAIASSHFGHGIVTFHTGYLFRTDPGVGLWARGAPNWPKDGIAPLEGIIETDWIDFTFTMNWQFTRPGSVTFEKGEPFCFITPFAYRSLDAVRPEILAIDSDRDTAAAFEERKTSRNDFNKRLSEFDEEVVRKGWEKWYMRGLNPAGERANPAHLSKLRLATPIRRDEGGRQHKDDEGA